MIKYILIGIIIILNAYFAYVLFTDKKKDDKKINNVQLSISSYVIFFLSGLGMSDFALSSALYNKLKWVKIEELTGTINVQTILPTAVISIFMLTSVKVDPTTLIVLLIAQSIGAIIGPKLYFKTNIAAIKKIVAIGLVIAAFMIVAVQMHWIPSNGTAYGLTGAKLWISAGLFFVYGILSNFGIGCYALIMATTYFMGMNPLAAFPIMMANVAIASPLSATQFIKHKLYNKQISVVCSLIGILGTVTTSFFITNIDTNLLKWLVVIVLIYTSYTMLFKKDKEIEEEGNKTPLEVENEPA